MNRACNFANLHFLKEKNTKLDISIKLFLSVFLFKQLRSLIINKIAANGLQ